jgi:Rps23 Pro-64 3,4-dihydroxylase Tpa1-like proline 4-hydroxylase
MIKIVDNILNNEELKILQNECNNFVITDKPNFNNFYNRIEINQKLIPEFIKSVNTILLNELGDEYILIPSKSTWINYINTTTNKNDNFHKDIAEVSIVIYLNDNFDGGELEYIDKNGIQKKYLPKINSAVIMTDNVWHRVLPVTNGNRFSFVCFFENKNTKLQKTLL